MKNTLSIEIEAPIQVVFDFIHDPQKHKLWLQGLEETIYEPDYDPDHPLGELQAEDPWRQARAGIRRQSNRVRET